MSIYIGTSGYAYKEWKGKFYPDKIRPDEMLPYYSARFGAVELNNTYYKLPPPENFEKWRAETPADFKFAVKAPSTITHIRRLKDIAEPLRQLLEAAAPLKEKMGPVLFQLPPNFKQDLARLKEFLKALPPKGRFTMEFRNETWFTEETFALLRDHQVALCVAEAEDSPAAPALATAGWGYLRLRRLNYTLPELRKWADFISAQKWSNAYVFFRHEETGTGPRFAGKLIEVMGGSHE